MREEGAGGRLDLTGLSIAFGPIQAVHGVDLHLEAGSFTALVGPSGCGKSTLLHLVAGLESPGTGEVALDGEPMTSVPAERRPVGLVLQRPLLFPHLDVAGNVAFGLRRRGMRRREARLQAGAMLEQVGVADLGARRVGELSGGQEQRVALARALVLRPRVLLLDEPFSALDAPLRSQMRDLVRGLADDLGVTTVFVTHDQAEAVEVADDIALMLEGRVVAHGPVAGFFTAPPSLAAARFFAATNELAGWVRDGRFHTDESPAGSAWPPVRLPDGPAVLVVRPESLSIESRADGPAAVRVRGTATGLRFAGTHQVLDVELPGGTRLRAHVPVGSHVRLGAPVTLVAGPGSATVLPAGGGGKHPDRSAGSC